MSSSQALVLDRRTLTDLHPSSWEHPADRAALETLRKVPGLDLVLKKLVGTFKEKSIALLFQGNAIRVGPRQLPRLLNLQLEVQQTLDIREEIPLFVTQEPFFNAGAYGIDNPFIVLNSTTLDLLGEDEQRALLGHELGHVASGHALYHTMLSLLLTIGSAHLPFPAELAVLPIRLALQEWSRKSELSADRAALLATQSLSPVVKLHMIAAGGGFSFASELSVDAYLEQARAYEDATDADALFKLLNTMEMSHPFNTVRAAEIVRWSNSRDYSEILRGTYRKKSEPENHSLGDDLKDGASYYAAGAKETIKEAATNARKKVQEVADAAVAAAEKVSRSGEK